MKDVYTTGNSTCIPEIKITQISKEAAFSKPPSFHYLYKFGRVFCNSQTLKFPKSSKAARLRTHQVLCSFECFLITFDWEPIQVHSLCSSYLNHQEWPSLEWSNESSQKTIYYPLTIKYFGLFQIVYNINVTIMGILYM